jgi:hypothetical protein
VGSDLRCSLVLVTAMIGLGVIAAPASAELPRTYRAVVIENPAPAPGDRFGDGLVNAGDVNGDGEDDLLVGIDEHAMIEGQVFVFSGADGSLIRRIPPPDPDVINASVMGNPDNVAAFGTQVGRIADIGSCPGFAGRPGQDCAASGAAIDAALDGVPDQIVSAIGVDVNDAAGDDMGMAYVLDGASGAVLKRIRMPPGDRAEQATNSPGASMGPGFGRTIISPSGQPPCAGFGGLASKAAGSETKCAYAATSFVARGDIDGGGRPDIGIGASDFTDAGGGAGASDNPVCTTTCFQTGRYYVFRGEDLAGLAPSQPLEDSYYTIKNPMAQNDTADINSRFHREALGYSIAPVGDLGRCKPPNTTPIADTDDPATYFCLNSANDTAPDGRPDFILSAHRTDWNGMGDVGVAFAVDGATGRIMDIYRPTEPQQSAIFAFSNYNTPAVGDLGSSAAPDVYLSAMVQDVQHRAQGRGWVLTGDFRSGGANHYEIAVLDDPTPHQIGNFGTSSAGLGDIAGDFHNEIAVGAYGPHAPQVVDDVPSDVHIFSPPAEAVVQSIPDPAAQPGSGFGRALAPMGDLNDDGFLDLAVGSGGYDAGAAVTCSPCTAIAPAQGRIYLMLSDNSPAPPTPPGPPATAALAGRALELVANRARVRAGRALRLSGTLEAFANEAACRGGQAVAIQRRAPRATGYMTVGEAITNALGAFSFTTRPTDPSVYRARVAQSPQCLGATSPPERVAVLRAARVVSTRATLGRSGLVGVRVACPAGETRCSGIVGLRTAGRIGGARRTLGKKAFRAPAGDRRTVRLRVSASLAQLLRRQARVRLVAVVVNRDPEGNALTTRKRLTLLT